MLRHRDLISIDAEREQSVELLALTAKRTIVSCPTEEKLFYTSQRCAGVTSKILDSIFTGNWPKRDFFSATRVFCRLGQVGGNKVFVPAHED